ncbi:MAG: hypothetical protein ACD_81C00070G0004 [uncultured bacterium]|uniref:Triosephosphate isomerase n=1 Tax=Candidatus Wolfebacteria bacterium GW2011_GWE2_44_13 TaxID=1619017 RepID=A0A0G1K4I9_9BACT|nr:MAG: hypothetical protein ACD_81C00070G0004 [uncultured bacterium]KKT42749.1 MAG: Triosephosphate isomerase [Candidatus Wolfebacteria bacterium GW2011_GWE2_44_13]
MAKKLIIANWKMHPLTLREAGVLVDVVEDAQSNIDIVLAPPFVFIEHVACLTSPEIKIGAQDVYWEDPSKGGAYTGEISASMLKKLGVTYVIVGHSERRQYLQETDAMIGAKLATAIKAGLVGVLCVGEPMTIRSKGKAAVKQYIRKQLDGAFRDMRAPLLQSKKIVIAYEPIWAISTSGEKNHEETPEDAVEVISYIKSILAADYAVPTVRVLYGGSVNSKNITGFVEQEAIDGALVGGASVDKKEFKKIVAIVSNL